ncbi:preprotein translocase subunit SecG [Helicobacter sp. MIT 14-3879]|nr:preprotein translocase subunit SecG [Helicobacter sp. MIT 14-3879]
MFMTSFLIVLQAILSVIIVVVVLLQKSSSIGLGAYSGSNESLFGAKGPANFMAKITMLLGFIFIANTIALGYLYNVKANKSIVDGVDIPKETLPISVPFDGFNTSNTTPLSNPKLHATQPQLTPNMEGNTDIPASVFGAPTPTTNANPSIDSSVPAKTQDKK